MEGRPRQDPAPPTRVQPPVPVGERRPTAGERQPPLGERPPPLRARPIEEELDGIRAWLADIDRKLGTRTYAGAAAVVLALAAAIVALVLAIDARDNSAGQGDVERLETQISEVAERAGAAQSTGQDVSSLESRIAALEADVGDEASGAGDLDARIAALESDVEALQSEPGGGTAAGGGGTDSGGNQQSGGPLPGPNATDEAPSDGSGGGTGP